MAETTKQWMKRIGSRKALEKRVAQRLAGEINAPMPRHARVIKKKMTGVK